MDKKNFFFGTSLSLKGGFHGTLGTPSRCANVEISIPFTHNYHKLCAPVATGKPHSLDHLQLSKLCLKEYIAFVDVMLYASLVK